MNCSAVLSVWTFTWNMCIIVEREVTNEVTQDTDLTSHEGLIDHNCINKTLTSPPTIPKPRTEAWTYTPLQMDNFPRTDESFLGLVIGEPNLNIVSKLCIIFKLVDNTIWPFCDIWPLTSIVNFSYYIILYHFPPQYKSSISSLAVIQLAMQLRGICFGVSYKSSTINNVQQAFVQNIYVYGWMLCWLFLLFWCC